MSNYLTGLAQLNPQVKRHNGGTTTLTLDQNGTTNATMLFVNGVAQSPGTDFNVSGATLTTTSTLPAGTNICTTIQYFNTGVVNAPADNSVTGAKLDVSLVQGDVLTATGTDTLARLAKGTANQQLTMNAGATAVEWQSNKNAVLISSVTASSSATVDFATGFSAGFSRYVLDITSMAVATDHVELQLLVTDDSGSSYESSGYEYATHVQNSGASHTTYAATGASFILLTFATASGGSIGNAATESFNTTITFYAPSNTSHHKLCDFYGSYITTSAQCNLVAGTGLFDGNTSALTGFRLLTDSGAIASGTFKLYGIE